MNIKGVFSNFSTTFVWNISHSKKNWARCDRKCILVFMWSTGYCCQIFRKVGFTRNILEKYSNIKFHENPLGGSRIVPCGRTHMTKLIVAFRNLANTPKNCAARGVFMSGLLPEVWQWKIFCHGLSLDMKYGLNLFVPQAGRQSMEWHHRASPW